MAKRVLSTLGSCHFMLAAGLMIGGAGCGAENASESYKLYEAELVSGDLTGVLTVTSSWGSGYCANMSARNTGNATLNWSATVELGQARLAQSWNSTPAVSGSRVTFTGKAWNASLPPGGTADIGYCASGTGTPSLVALAGGGEGGGGTGGTGGSGGSGGTGATGGGGEATKCPASAAAVYPHVDYSGTPACLEPGRYDTAQLRALGVADNSISSVTVPAGYRIRLFADAAFSGASTDLTSSAASLFDRAFNDVASSVEVKAQETPDGGRPPQSGARKRVKQANGTLVSDAGTQLRGFGMSPDSGHNATNRGYAIKRDLTRSYGLNALHVFGECWSNTPGANMSVIDEIVALGRQHQYYVILAVGGCGDDEIRDEFGRRIHGNGAYDIKWLRKFWAIYAPRYKNETHVIYEIMNEPSFDNCSGQYQDHVFNMNAEMYKQIRGAAPDSHILMLTYPNLKNGRIVADAVDKLKSRGVDFANASIAAHGYDWGKDCNKPPAEALPDMLAGARSKDVALTVTEFDAETWKEFVGPLEKAGISYTHFKYVTGSDTSSFKSEFQNLNLSWCPDYGLWPQDSATCRR